MVGARQAHVVRVKARRAVLAVLVPTAGDAQRALFVWSGGGEAAGREQGRTLSIACLSRGSLQLSPALTMKLEIKPKGSS